MKKSWRCADHDADENSGNGHADGGFLQRLPSPGVRGIEKQTTSWRFFRTKSFGKSFLFCAPSLFISVCFNSAMLLESPAPVARLQLFKEVPQWFRLNRKFRIQAFLSGSRWSNCLRTDCSILQPNSVKHILYQAVFTRCPERQKELSY